MKFVLFLIKTLSMILCLGLLGAYCYYAFFAADKSEFMANASLLLFVLSAVVTSLTVVLSENKKSAPVTGIDAYLADLRKEEKNTAKHIQDALPKDLVPMLEKVVTAVGENKEVMNTTLLDSKTAFSSALSENKNALSSLLSENQGSLMAAVTESMRILETRLADNNNSFGETLNNLLDQVKTLATKNAAPINMALENINARLDDLENKIVSNRVGSLASEMPEEIQNTASAEDFGNFDAALNDFTQAPLTEPEVIEEPIEATEPEPETTQYDFTEPATEDTPIEAMSAEEPVVEDTPIEEVLAEEPVVEDTPITESDNTGYDFSSWDTPTGPTVEDSSAAEEQSETAENPYDFTAETADDTSLVQADETVEISPTEEPFADTDADPFAYHSEASSSAETEPDMADSVSGYADNLAPNAETDQRNAFDDDLSALADLEIMQEPVAPTAEPQFDEIDIDEFLKGRTDVKN